MIVVTDVVGRVRRALAPRIERALSEQLGINATVDPARLWPAKGAYRTDVRQDSKPWGGLVTVHYPMVSVDHIIESWDTMTDLVRRGFTVERDGSTFELHVSPKSLAQSSSQDRLP